MPLQQGSGEKVISSNIAELIRAGHSSAQAAAIAYKEAGKDSAEVSKSTSPSMHKASESNREYDEFEGWYEVKDNPISKVGVFPYSGAQIARNKEEMDQFGIEPDKIYKVYRSSEALSDPETAKSFRLRPIVNDHTMLGNDREAGLTPAEEKGTHGIIGEQIYFDENDGYLKANLKIFSKKLANIIDYGKEQLSIGYRCAYEKVAGVFNGEAYDFIQTMIRGNHLAVVDEGRSGPDVSVLDHFKYTFDAGSLKMEEKEKDLEKKTGDESEITEEETMSLSDICRAIKELKSMMGADKAAKDSEEGVSEEESKKAEMQGDEAEEEKPKEEAKDESTKRPLAGEFRRPGATLDSKRYVMDEKDIYVRIHKRDCLAKDISEFVGTFDSSQMTYEEVAKYGVKKLGLDCKSGHETSMLNGYFKAAKKSKPVNFSQDSTSFSSTTKTWIEKALASAI